MPKKIKKKIKKPEISIEPVLQDFNVTSLSDMQDGPYPADSTVYEAVKSYDMELPNTTFNKTENISSGPFPNDSTNTKANKNIFKRPLNLQKRRIPRHPSELDSSAYEVDPIDESFNQISAAPKILKITRKRKINNSLFDKDLNSSNDSCNISITVPKILTRKAREKKSLHNSLFDKDLVSSESDATIINEKPFARIKTRKININPTVFDSDLNSSNSFEQNDTSAYQQHPFKYTKPRKTNIDPAMFDSVLNSSNSFQQSSGNLTLTKKNSKENPIQAENDQINCSVAPENKDRSKTYVDVPKETIRENEIKIPQPDSQLTPIDDQININTKMFDKGLNFANSVQHPYYNDISLTGNNKGHLIQTENKQMNNCCLITTNKGTSKEIETCRTEINRETEIEMLQGNSSLSQQLNIINMLNEQTNVYSDVSDSALNFSKSNQQNDQSATLQHPFENTKSRQTNVIPAMHEDDLNSSDSFKQIDLSDFKQQPFNNLKNRQTNIDPCMFDSVLNCSVSFNQSDISTSQKGPFKSLKNRQTNVNPTMFDSDLNSSNSFQQSSSNIALKTMNTKEYHVQEETQEINSSVAPDNKEKRNKEDTVIEEVSREAEISMSQSGVSTPLQLHSMHDDELNSSDSFEQIDLSEFDQQPFNNMKNRQTNINPCMFDSALNCSVSFNQSDISTSQKGPFKSLKNRQTNVNPTMFDSDLNSSNSFQQSSGNIVLKTMNTKEYHVQEETQEINSIVASDNKETTNKEDTFIVEVKREAEINMSRSDVSTSQQMHYQNMMNSHSNINLATSDSDLNPIKSVQHPFSNSKLIGNNKENSFQSDNVNINNCSLAAKDLSSRNEMKSCSIEINKRTSIFENNILASQTFSAKDLEIQESNIKSLNSKEKKKSIRIENEEIQNLNVSSVNKDTSKENKSISIQNRTENEISQNNPSQRTSQRLSSKTQKKSQRIINRSMGENVLNSSNSFQQSSTNVSFETENKENSINCNEQFNNDSEAHENSAINKEINHSFEMNRDSIDFLKADISCARRIELNSDNSIKASILPLNDCSPRKSIKGKRVSFNINVLSNEDRLGADILTSSMIDRRDSYKLEKGRRSVRKSILLNSLCQEQSMVTINESNTNKSVFSLDSLVFNPGDGPSGNLTSDSVLIDLYASKSKDTSSSCNSKTNFYQFKDSSSENNSPHTTSDTENVEDSEEDEFTETEKECDLESEANSLEAIEDEAESLEEESLKEIVDTFVEEVESVTEETDEASSLVDEVEVDENEEDEPMEVPIEDAYFEKEPGESGKNDDLTQGFNGEINNLALIKNVLYEKQGDELPDQIQHLPADTSIKFKKPQKVPLKRGKKTEAVFKEPIQKQLSKTKYKEILNKMPFSELKKKKRKENVPEISRVQMQQDEIENALRKRKITETTFKMTNKLKRPKKWVSKALYDFIISKLTPHYGIKSRIQAEKVVIFLVDHIEHVLKEKTNYFYIIEEIKKELASLRIIQTHWDFRMFVNTYCDGTFKDKMAKRNPYEPKNPLETIL